MVERSLSMREVAGSIPASSTSFFFPSSFLVFFFPSVTDAHSPFTHFPFFFCEFTDFFGLSYFSAQLVVGLQSIGAILSSPVLFFYLFGCFAASRAF
jgi:hypothetical protein